MGKSWGSVALILLLALEVWLFTGSWSKFFNNDSLFYIVNAPSSWKSFLHTFTAPDEARQYRPLTLGAMGFLASLLGTDPRHYHWIPLVLHLGNTLLLYLLAKRLLADTIVALASASFWGLHSVAGWVCYDIGFISDSFICFLLLVCLLFAVAGAQKSRFVYSAAAILIFCAALLTKESAVAFPVAIGICLFLAYLRNNPRRSSGDLLDAIRKSAPVTIASVVVALGFAGVLLYFLHTGLLYRQGVDAPYHIDPWNNWWGKLRYLVWSMNFPDVIRTGVSVRKHIFAWVMTVLLWCACTIALARRKGRLSMPEWSGVVWLFALNLPALMLANRVGKWYLYVPLLGFSLTFGSLIGTLARGFRRYKSWLVPSAFFALCTAPVLFSSWIQTQSFLTSSSVSYVSDLYASLAQDFRKAQPHLPSRVTLYFLPPFEESVAAVLAAPPINNGELFKLYYPTTQFEVLFAYKGDRLPVGYRRSAHVYILQFLDGRLFDVSSYYKSGGKLKAFILPTAEKQVPPLLALEPIGGRKLWEQHVYLMIGDRGATLPADFYKNPELWILEYLNGHFYDVTEFYKVSIRDPARKLVRDIAEVRARVSREEYYADYSHFDTPTGAPVFFPTPRKDILTQIGGSEVTVPVDPIPSNATLRFDISWMHDIGDGGWAEIRLRTREGERTLFRRYMNPNPRGKGFEWQPVRISLKPFANRTAELVLRCYNDRGKNAVGDWLNWRNLSISF